MVNNWNNNILYLVGGLEHEFYFPIILGMSYSQLTFTLSFFRGVGSTTNQKIMTIICVA